MSNEGSPEAEEVPKDEDRRGTDGNRVPTSRELHEEAQKPRPAAEPAAPPESRVSKIPKYPASVPAPPADLDPYQPRVDKFFGSKLPPVCRKLGCYVTDNGKFFYCINPNCHKDKKRETKYNRRKKSFIYFFCPKCRSREIQLHLRKNQYECMDCAYNWRK